MKYVFDIETNGLLDKDPLRIHCIVFRDLDTGEEFLAGPPDVKAAIHNLARADLLVGHNISRFDLHVLDRCGWKPNPDQSWYDTFSASKLIFGNNLFATTMRMRKGEEANRYAKSHGLEAWGYRLREPKHEAPSSFDEYTPEMLEYCRQDVRLNEKLFRFLIRANAEQGWPTTPDTAVFTESVFAYILMQQELRGIGFDYATAATLHVEWVARREKLLAKLQEFFPPWYEEDGKKAEVVTKRTRTLKAGRDYPQTYVEGCPHTKVKRVTFSPASDHNIATALQRTYGWEPVEFTATGQPEVSERVLAKLDYPAIPTLLEAIMLGKRLGQLVEGKQGWMGAVKGDGNIHHRVSSPGTRTSRCTHSHPNLAQVPRVTSPLGKECRALFGPVDSNNVMVGVDAKGLELRMLAHYLAYWDNGAFAKVLAEKDPHMDWMRHSRIFIRDNQKTFTYAWLYGAGNEKLGEIRLADWREAYTLGRTEEPPPSGDFVIELGKASRRRIQRNVPGIQNLLAATRAAYQKGYIVGLDGRLIPCQTEYGVLNDLLQSAGAIVMKKAKVLLWEAIRERYGKDFWWLLDVHDEWQFEATTAYATSLADVAVEAIRSAGRVLAVKMPLDADYRIGANWSETH